MEKFQTFSIMANEIFYPKSHREKDNLIKTYPNLLKIRFRKLTHVFDNTMISRRKTFSKKDSIKVIKTQNHTTWQNSWSYVTIRELQARNHDQFSATKTSFAKDKIKKKNISWYQNWDIWVFLKLNPVSKTPKSLKTTQRS